MSDPDRSDWTDERLEAWLATAPPPAAPGFAARVMRAIEARPRTWQKRLRRFWFTPHTLRWNAAGAAAVFSVLLSLVVVALVRDRPSIGTAATPGAVMVRFDLSQPQAHRVALAGDFTEWEARILLRRQPDGTWTAQIPLAPGDYEYTFVVDDERWIADPRARRYREDGFGNRNAVMRVPGHEI